MFRSMRSRSSAFATVLLAICLTASCPSASRADDVNRIAAVVNDDIISIRDLESRVHIAITMANVPDTMDSRRRVVPQVLHKMIDERLQMQEAKRLKISLSSKEIEDGIRGIEEQNKLPKGGLQKDLEARGLDFDVLREQITADFTWIRVGQATVQNNLKVGDDEINDRLETIKARQGKPEYNVVEIFLPADNPAQDEQARALGERLIDQLKQGAPFQVLARQFSQSATAASGGQMGWVSEGMIDDDLMAALSQTEQGGITPMVHSIDGYRILGLLQKRIANDRLPTHDAVRRIIEDERQEMMMQRYIRDLRRSAFIDIRI